MRLREVEMVFDWTGLPESSVKHFEQPRGVDTVLHKNLPLEAKNDITVIII